MSNSSSGKTEYGWARRTSNGTPVARRFGPDMHMRNAVALSMVPRPRIRRTKISFSLRRLMIDSICVLERVEVADRLVIVRVLAQLLDAAMEIAEDGIEVDDVLAVDLEDDPQDAVRRGMLRPDVDEHLAVAQFVELCFTFGPRRVRRDRFEDADLLVEDDPRIVLRRVAPGARRHPGQARVLRMVAAGVALRGAWVCSMWRTPAPGERAASSARKKSFRSGKLW